MNNWITNLEIKNFKSIKDIKLDCKRINVFIGKPNVGKSNILEALTLFVTPFCDPNKKILSEYIRFEKLSNLFYDQDRKNDVIVNSNIGYAALRFHMNNINAYDIMIGPDINVYKKLNNSQKTYTLFDINRLFNELSFNEPDVLNLLQPIKPFYASINEANPDSNTRINTFQGNMSALKYDTPIKKYHFIPFTDYNNHNSHFLNPPSGNNLYTILESNPSLYDECTHFFKEYGLDLLIDTEYEKIEVQKRVGHRVYKIPYTLAADTLQRVIFHLAAIETNENSILLFEEPENHSFPPYVKLLSEKIVDNKNNQYFIATHSPYLLTPFIEQATSDDVSIFIVGYKNFETKVRVLSKDEIKNIMDTGIDLFFNISAFQND